MNSPVVKISDTDSIKCSNCNRQLMIVYCRPMTDERREQLTKNNALLSKVQAECAYCGDKSYQYEITGEFRYHPAQGIKIVDFKQNADNVVFKTSR